MVQATIFHAFRINTFHHRVFQIYAKVAAFGRFSEWRARASLSAMEIGCSNPEP
jgi:hypothetical protein